MSKKRKRTMRVIFQSFIVMLGLMIAIYVLFIMIQNQSTPIVKSEPKIFFSNPKSTTTVYYDWTIQDSVGKIVAYKKRGEKPVMIDSMSAVRVLKKMRQMAYPKFNI